MFWQQKSDLYLNQAITNRLSKGKLILKPWCSRERKKNNNNERN